MYPKRHQKNGEGEITLINIEWICEGEKNDPDLFQYMTDIVVTGFILLLLGFSLSITYFG